MSRNSFARSGVDMPYSNALIFLNTLDTASDSRLRELSIRAGRTRCTAGTLKHVASIAPPCISVSCFAIDRPEPRPPRSRVIPPSACRNRSKTCGRNSGGIPMPVSLTVTSRCEFTRSSRLGPGRRGLRLAVYVHASLYRVSLVSTNVTQLRPAGPVGVPRSAVAQVWTLAAPVPGAPSPTSLVAWASRSGSGGVQDVTYGAGVTELDKEPTVIQVLDFGDRFYVFALYDQRTNEIGRTASSTARNLAFT